MNPEQNHHRFFGFLKIHLAFTLLYFVAFAIKVWPDLPTSRVPQEATNPTPFCWNGHPRVILLLKNSSLRGDKKMVNGKVSLWRPTKSMKLVGLANMPSLDWAQLPDLRSRSQPKMKKAGQDCHLPFTLLPLELVSTPNNLARLGIGAFRSFFPPTLHLVY